ncbi:hypothetical protein H4CHR_04408 [Variovorax sp. PBS-H4]|uniref:hypothetical protein n=1 Tax=Variovorax sp. PBS-H4 TaxID=434008 RepID=UPI001316A8B2|nr:hypothetical protein [Variovorax sp. PBS-H4]VTU38369.1 hypothetical protein H4CHR_04408 [Variovorax sp. PBS-H4]
MTLHISVPLKTGNGLNDREQAMARHRRVKSERAAVQWLLNGKPTPAGSVYALMVRVSPSSKGLDKDNLQGSLKAVRDQIATWLGRDDADGKTITWDYGQRPGKKGEWAVEIHLTETAQP